MPRRSYTHHQHQIHSTIFLIFLIEVVEYKVDFYFCISEKNKLFKLLIQNEFA